MNRMFAIFCTVAIATLTTACSREAGTTGDGKPDSVAVVDGAAISRNTFNEYAIGAAGKPAEDLTQEQRNAMLENLVRAQVLAREAETSGVAKEAKVAASLELSRLNVLTQAMTEHYLKDRKATEEELRAEYDTQVASMDKVQYRASHILVATEEAAKKITAQLQAGGNFAQIAGRESLDPSTKEKGGDLDWFSPSAITPAFANAVRSLKKGETTPAPIETNLGWHVLRVTDTRDAVAPSFEIVRDRLANPVEARKMKTYVDGLVAKAKVTKTL